MFMLIEATQRVREGLAELIRLVNDADTPTADARRVLEECKRFGAQVAVLQADAAALVAARERHGDGGVGVLAQAAGLFKRDAASQVKTAANLQSMPAVRDAVQSGDISLANARTLAGASDKTSTQQVQQDSQLLQKAAALSPEQFSQEAGRWTTRRQADGGEDAYQRQRARRRLSIWDGDDGMVHLRGELDPVAGAKVRKRFLQQAERLRRADLHSPGGERRSFNQRMADALDTLSANHGSTVDASGTGNGVDTGTGASDGNSGTANSDTANSDTANSDTANSGTANSDTANGVDTGTGASDGNSGTANSGTAKGSSDNSVSGKGRSISGKGSRASRKDSSGRSISDKGSRASRKDSSGRSISDKGSRASRKGGSGTGKGNSASRKGGRCGGGCGKRPSADIVIVQHLSAAGTRAFAEIAGGGTIPTSVLEEHFCDAEFTGVVFSDKGKPLWQGPTKQTATEAQKRALRALYGACGGCGAPLVLCQSHHIDPVSQGGPSDIDNMMMLCWACHQKVHLHDWRVVPDGRGLHTIEPPERIRYGPARAPDPPPAHGPTRPRPPKQAAPPIARLAPTTASPDPPARSEAQPAEPLFTMA